MIRRGRTSVYAVQPKVSIGYHRSAELSAIVPVKMFVHLACLYIHLHLCMLG